jgi:hypothetical protein
LWQDVRSSNNLCALLLGAQQRRAYRAGSNSCVRNCCAIVLQLERLLHRTGAPPEAMSHINQIVDTIDFTEYNNTPDEGAEEAEFEDLLQFDVQVEAAVVAAEADAAAPAEATAVPEVEAAEVPEVAAAEVPAEEAAGPTAAPAAAAEAEAEAEAEAQPTSKRGAPRKGAAPRKPKRVKAA